MTTALLLVQILFYASTAIIAILSYLRARHTLFLPFKSEVFKERIPAIRECYKYLLETFIVDSNPNAIEEYIDKTIGGGFLIVNQLYCEVYLGATNPGITKSIETLMSHAIYFDVARADGLRWRICQINTPGFDDAVELDKEISDGDDSGELEDGNAPAADRRFIESRLERLREGCPDLDQRRYLPCVWFEGEKPHLWTLPYSQEHLDVMTRLTKFERDVLLPPELRKLLAQLREALNEMHNPIGYYQDVLDGYLRAKPNHTELDFRVNLVPKKFSDAVKCNYSTSKRELLAYLEKFFDISWEAN